MEWEEVRVFLAVLEAGSFTEAAKTLGQHQSTVSRRMVALEERLGGRLFHRTARCFSPTPLAERLRSEAEQAAAAIERLRRKAADPEELRGTVRLATFEEMTSELLVPALSELWKVAPGIDLVIDGRSELVPVGPGGADLALRLVRPEQAQLRLRKVGELRYGVYASPSYPVANGWENWSWLVLDDSKGLAPETRWLRSRLAAAAASPRLRLRCMDTRDLGRAAADGLGVAVLPHPIARRLELTTLEDTDLVRPIWLVTHEAFDESARVRAVMDWIVAICAARAGPPPNPDS